MDKYIEEIATIFDALQFKYDHEIETLRAAIIILNSENERLRNSLEQVRMATGLEPLPNTAKLSGWQTPKMVAHDTGYSLSNIKLRVRQGKVVSHKIGGRTLIDPASVKRLTRS